jgi:hypothetical protein
MAFQWCIIHATIPHKNLITLIFIGRLINLRSRSMIFIRALSLICISQLLLFIREILLMTGFGT